MAQLVAQIEWFTRFYHCRAEKRNINMFFSQLDASQSQTEFVFRLKRTRSFLLFRFTSSRCGLDLFKLLTFDGQI